MSWSRAANRMLVEAIVDTFRSSPEHARRRLAEFSARDWARTEFWLDASGLALYFLDRLQSIGIEDAVAAAVVKRLQQKLLENTDRRTSMFTEFVAINTMFQNAGVHYANLKGFTFSPDSCPNPALRHQIDFDFLIDPAHKATCRSLLEQQGYVLTAATQQTWEFKVGDSQPASMKEHYKTSRRRSVELHFMPDATDEITPTRDARLDRLGVWNSPAGTFPALSSADQMIGQALHILGHLRNESTRPSWLLEFRHHVNVRKNDKAFWREVHTLADLHPNAATALGLSVHLATELFGAFSPTELNAWTLELLHPGIKLWAERYGREALLADFPGTKLYLLLEAELEQGEPQKQRERLRRLLPRNGPQRIMLLKPQASLVSRLHQEFVQFCFVLFRLRFHAAQGFRYLLEAGRWKRLKRERGRSCTPSRQSLSHRNNAAPVTK